MTHFMKRRTFMKTVGKASASVFLPPLIGSCRTKTKPPVNILWIAVEDISPLMSCYGYDANQTPNLDRLAANGFPLFQCIHAGAGLFSLPVGINNRNDVDHHGCPQSPQLSF